LVALAALLGVGTVLAVVAILAGGSGEPESGALRVERFPAPTGLELIVYVQAADNQPDVAGGTPSVRIECADPGGRVVLRGNHPWPFTDTDAGTTDVDRVASCRLPGTEPSAMPSWTKSRPA